MSDEFEVTFYIDDGYAGSGGAPHDFTIAPADVYDMSEKSLREMFWEMIDEETRKVCHPYCDQESEFLAWAKEVQRERDSSEEAPDAD